MSRGLSRRETLARKRKTPRKALALPFKWPLLANGQDQHAREARLAFHIHRLNLNGKSLSAALGNKAYLSTALSQARVTVSDDFIRSLAQNLNIHSEDLQRPLLDQEHREWRFYRESWCHQKHVWSAAQRLWTRSGFTQNQVALLTGLSKSHLSHVLKGKKSSILNWQQANTLLQAIDHELQPEVLLPDDRSKSCP